MDTREKVISSDDCKRNRLKYGSGTSSSKEYPSEYEALLGVQKDLVYPKSVFFIVVNEFCERFSFYGMKAILTLYLRNMLKYTENTTTILYHSFVMFAYLTCIPGAILADSFLGKFKTIFYLSIVYALGNITLSFASIGTSPSFSWIPAIPFSFIGLALIAIGTGGIKPCVSAFGGDQFQIPGQEKSLEQFFFIFYFAINSGSMISTFVTPILRRDVSCLGAETCYPAAFGLPAILMVTALVIFLIGKPFYKTKRPTGNVVVQVIKCACHALSNHKRANHITCPNEHWLDNANDKYERDFISDVKKLFSIILLFAPLPVFWALFEQQGSRWTLQATKMNGFIFNGWIIKPDQMQVVNSFMVLLFIPLFDQLLYPALAKCNLLKKPLQRITLGGFLASLSFILAGLVELKLEQTYAILPSSSQCQLNFVNTLPCQLNLSLTESMDVNYLATTTTAGTEKQPLFTHTLLYPNENIVFKSLRSPLNYSVTIEPYQGAAAEKSCAVDGFSVEFNKLSDIVCQPKKALTVLIGVDEISNEGVLKYSSEGDDLVKSQDGNAKLKVILDGQIDPNIEQSSMVIIHSLTSSSDNYAFRFNTSSTGLSTSLTEEIQPDRYLVGFVSDATSSASPTEIMMGQIDVDTGGVYLLVIYPSRSSNVTSEDKNLKMKLIEQTSPNTVHMLLLLPQYFVITTAEILFSITGYAFSYAEAPVSMKSVIQAVWLLTNVVGSLIVVLVTEFNLFPRQVIQFFFFSGLMFIATVIFIILAYRYTPVQNRKQSTIFMKTTTLPATAIENFFQLSETDLTTDDDDKFQ